mmetsp:Transcript_88639/g.271360  ORF Transcript_88639/g.271360 Transcript_88639/m.271360 type:complete len:318 (+) Transcript_88639:1248-2201(+)
MLGADAEARNLVERHFDRKRAGDCEQSDDCTPPSLHAQLAQGLAPLLFTGIKDTHSRVARALPSLRPETDGNGPEQASSPVYWERGNDIVDAQTLHAGLRCHRQQCADHPDTKGRPVTVEGDACGDGDEAGEDAEAEALRTDDGPVEHEHLEHGREGAGKGTESGVDRDSADEVGTVALDLRDIARIEPVPADPKEEDAPDGRQRVGDRDNRGLTCGQHVVVRVARPLEHELGPPALGRHVVVEPAYARADAEDAHQRLHTAEHVDHTASREVAEAQLRQIPVGVPREERRKWVNQAGGDDRDHAIGQEVAALSHGT